MNLSKCVVLDTYTLAENLEWLKLNDHRKLQINVADKIAVRKYMFQNTNNPNLLNHLYGVVRQPR